jgi:hypothetical protein
LLMLYVVVVWLVFLPPVRCARPRFRQPVTKR